MRQVAVVLLLSVLLLVLELNVTAADYSHYPDYPMGYFRYPNQHRPQEQEITPDFRYTIRPSRPAIDQEEVQPLAKFLFNRFRTVIVEHVIWHTLTATTGVISTAIITSTATERTTLTDTTTSTATATSTSLVTSTTTTTSTATVTPTVTVTTTSLVTPTVTSSVTSTVTSTETKTVTSTTGTTTAGYTYVNGLGYYRVYPAFVTFDEAKAKCEADGAKMIIINSNSEADAMVTLMTAAGVSKGWVGLTDSVTEGTILTILGDPLSSTFELWAPGDPNNADDWDCVYMDAAVPGMVMFDCVNNPSPAVCEI